MEVQALTRLAALANTPMDHLPTTILEDRETLTRRSTRTTPLGTVLGMTKMDQVEEKEKERATEARNKSRCLPALDLLTDRWTLPLSPLLPPSSLFSTVWSWPTSETRGARTRTAPHLPRVLRVPQLCT